LRFGLVCRVERHGLSYQRGAVRTGRSNRKAPAKGALWYAQSARRTGGILLRFHPV